MARKNLDHYMRTSTSDAFRTKQKLIHSKPNISYGASKRDAEWKALRKEMKGDGGGFKFVLAIFLGVLAMVMMRRKS